MIIQDSVGYEFLKDLNAFEIMQITPFLKIVSNYQRLIRLNEKTK